MLSFHNVNLGKVRCFHVVPLSRALSFWAKLFPRFRTVKLIFGPHERLCWKHNEEKWGRNIKVSSCSFLTFSLPERICSDDLLEIIIFIYIFTFVARPFCYFWDSCLIIILFGSIIIIQQGSSYIHADEICSDFLFKNAMLFCLFE